MGSDGRFDEAIDIYRQTLPRWSELLGPTDANVLATRTNLVRRNGSSRPLSTTRLRSPCLPRTRSTTTYSFRPLYVTCPRGRLQALALQSVGEHAEGEALQREELALCREAFGEDHPDTQIS